MPSPIASVIGRQLWDSRGRPTVEAEVILASGAVGRAIAPAGASRGAHEAIDLRDGGTAFGGFGVNRAVAGIGAEIAPAITGMDAHDQAVVDAALCALDNTPNKARLGANAVVACRWRCSTPPPPMRGCRCGAISRAMRRSASRSPKSRFSAAARTPGGAPTSRTHDHVSDSGQLPPHARNHRRCLPRRGHADGGEGPTQRCRRRGRLVAQFRVERGCARHAHQGDRGERPPRRRGCLHLARHRRQRTRRRLGLQPRARRRPPDERGDGCAHRRMGGSLSDPVDRGSGGAGRLDGDGCRYGRDRRPRPDHRRRCARHKCRSRRPRCRCGGVQRGAD